MSADTKIEWCDATFNPWEGCTKVSPGCAHCYAEARNRRFSAGANWGPGAPRRRTSATNWRQPVKWARDAADAARDGVWEQIPRPRVFCASLADWLDDEVPIAWLSDLLALIHATPNLDWLMLSKRPQNWKKRLQEIVFESTYPDGTTTGDVEWIEEWLANYAPPNVWIGTTCEDQPRADERIPQLLAIPARVRFLSCEPLIGPVNLPLYIRGNDTGSTYSLPGIHWVICGGESGPKARPMHPEWSRVLRDQCAAAGVAFFFKQWGEWLPCDQIGDRANFTQMHYQEDTHCEWVKVGKHAAGRLLDGIEHGEFPVSVCSVGTSPS